MRREPISFRVLDAHDLAGGFGECADTGAIDRVEHEGAAPLGVNEAGIAPVSAHSPKPPARSWASSTRKEIGSRRMTTQYIEYR